MTRARRAGPSPSGTARKITKPRVWHFCRFSARGFASLAAGLRQGPRASAPVSLCAARPCAGLSRGVCRMALAAAKRGVWRLLFVSRKTTRLVSGLRYTKMVSHAGKIYMRNHFYSMTYYSISKLQEGTPIAEKGRFKYQPFKCRCTIV